ncbi:MAG TPA: tetratricopeptide repeat protein [Candidatus Margulisiibacteriota bacterium]|nr:tetratricopeptide repeat protein [Candidatus Margulisiibacteriota bacterium]
MKEQFKSPGFTKPGILLIKFLLILVFFLPQFALAQSDKEKESLFVAKKAFEDGFYDVSLGLAERFLKSYPDSDQRPQVSLLIGECYFHQSKFLEALAQFEPLLQDPSAKDIQDAVLYWIAEVHFKGNSFSKSATFYKKIIDDFPKSTYLPAAYYSLGWCLFQEQKFAEALEYFKIAESKYPKEQQAKDIAFKIIECLYNLKDYAGLKEKAKSYLKESSGDNSRSSYFYFYSAEADYYLDNFTDAIQAYSKAISGSSDGKIKALSKLGLGWSYLKSKKYQEAQTAFQEISQELLERNSVDVLLLGKAILLTETNKMNEAVKAYEELANVTAQPLILMQAYLGKADALSSLAEYTEAIKTYKEALSKLDAGLIPADTADKIHYGLAWVYLKEGEFKEAIIEFQKVASASGDNIVKVSALCQIGDAYQDSGDYEKAQQTYDNILKSYPDSLYGDYVQYQLGVTLLKESNYDGAITVFSTLKRNFPESKLMDDATYSLGLAYFQRQDYNTSKELFEKFQEEFKDSNLKSQALYLLGTSLYNLAKYQEAIEAFKNIIRLYGQETDLVQKAEYEIADCFDQMGNEKEAMARFKTLRSKYPDSVLTAEVMWWLGSYYYRHNDLSLAKRYFYSLTQDFPKSNLVVDAYYALGSISEDEEKHEEAIANFKKVIELGKFDLKGQAAIALADIYTKQGNLELVESTYKNILQEHPGLTYLVYPKIAELYLKKDNYSEALNYYRKSLEIVPSRDMAAIQFKIAEILESLNNPDQAIEEYLKIGYLYPDNAKLTVKSLLRIAEIYEGRENFKEAVGIYRKVISLNTEEAKFAQERIDWITQHTK